MNKLDFYINETYDLRTIECNWRGEGVFVILFNREWEYSARGKEEDTIYNLFDITCDEYDTCLKFLEYSKNCALIGHAKTVLEAIDDLNKKINLFTGDIDDEFMKLLSYCNELME